MRTARQSQDEQQRPRKKAGPTGASAGKRGAKSARADLNGIRDEPRNDDARSIVNSLSKGLRVLEAFTAERPAMTLSELARAANLDPGTAFRMLNTLVMLGYVARVPESRRFRLTLKVIDLGLHAIGRSDLRELARPILRSLVGEISEAASIGVLDGADILYIERVRAGLTRLGVDIRIGTNIPANCSVIGQAILAYLPPHDLMRVLDTPPRRGELTVRSTGKTELVRTLEKVRRQGYAIQDSAFGNGLRILAVPVLDLDGYPVAAVSVVAPAIRLSMEEFRVRALEPVRNAAQDIARALQASGTISTAV